MIFNKNRINFRKNLSKSIVTPKELWMALKSLGSSNENPSWEASALKINNTVEHNANSVLEGFKNYYSTLAESLVKMPPKHPINTPLTLLLNIMNIWSKGIILIWHLFLKTEFWRF